MLPFDVKLGTTPLELFTDVIPNAHRNLVPKLGDKDELVIAVRVDGDRECDSLRAVIRGNDITVSEGSGPANVTLLLEKNSLNAFLEDWATTRKWVPKFSPKGAALLTDPRVLKRIAQVTGSIEMGLPDFPGGPAKLKAAASGGKPGKVDFERDPDVKIEATNDLFEKMLAGAVLPEEALSQSLVKVEGKKMVALQFAFALAPFLAR
ncbi:MAG TPA: SCP2 sterol-binding domain-containing protein [Polyangiaceae bacterium]